MSEKYKSIRKLMGCRQILKKAALEAGNSLPTSPKKLWAGKKLWADGAHCAGCPRVGGHDGQGCAQYAGCIWEQHEELKCKEGAQDN